MIIAEQYENFPKKKERKWEESKTNYGATVEEIKAEFQALGLKSTRTTYEKKNNVIVADKALYECSQSHCSFAIRIVLLRKPNSRPFVEVSGKAVYFYSLIQ